MMTTITVKEWFARKIREEMGKYHLTPTYKYTDGYWINREAGTVTMNVVEQVGESEKAVKVLLDCETKVGMAAHDPWTAWIPKSQITKE